MGSNAVKHLVAACGITIGNLLSFSAQAQAVVDPKPQIVASGSAEAEVQPTKAAFAITVATTGATASAAGEENARISKAVLESLNRAGVKRDELVGSRLTVAARWDFDERSHRSRRSNYEATNTIGVATEALERIGNYVDAALTAGASGISDVRFSAKDLSSTRAALLSKAVAAARADAEAIARAGGGNLGELLLVTSEGQSGAKASEVYDIVVTGTRRGSAPTPTDITPGPIQVAANIVARWRFVPAAGK